MGMQHHEDPNRNVPAMVFATFLFGFVTGFIAFLFVSTGDNALPNAPKVDKGFSIEAQSYGGCEQVGRCPSYKITDDGSYAFTMPEGEGSPQVFEDTLPEKQIERIERLVQETNLKVLSTSTTTHECVALRGGAAERYTIVRDGDRFLFDSCVQDVHRSELFTSLRDFFVVFTALHRSES